MKSLTNRSTLIRDQTYELFILLMQYGYSCTLDAGLPRFERLKIGWNRLSRGCRAGRAGREGREGREAFES